MLAGSLCFLFAFLGVANSYQITFLDVLNDAAGASDLMMPGNVEVLMDYIETIPFLNQLPFFTSETALLILDSLSKRATWVVQLVQLNPSYIARNPGEVLFNIVLAAAISILFTFLFQNVFRLGKHRYFMENRFQKEVKFRRTLVVFHRDHLWNVIVTMVKYHLVLYAWNLTVIGGIWKNFEYAMVPYLVAENPLITWKEAKQLSSQMTRGYKWKMFQSKLSIWYMWFLNLIPIVALFTITPLSEQLNTEQYFVLRSRKDISRTWFTETGFDQEAYVRQTPLPVEEPSYVLQDIVLETPHVRKGNLLPYTVMDLIVIFFCFAGVGWLWEEGLTIVNHHVLVNRGVMYGPWLPIYGIGGTAMIVFLHRYKEQPNRLFFMGVGISAVLEYSASALLDFMFNSSYWDYKEMFMNINGRICLAGLLAFGFAGIFGVYVAGPLISRELNKLTHRKQQILCTLLVTLFLIDLVCVLIFGPNSGANVGGTF